MCFIIRSKENIELKKLTDFLYGLASVKDKKFKRNWLLIRIKYLLKK